MFQNSAPNLVTQLETINDKSIQNQAINLKKNIESFLNIVKFKPHEQYYALSKILFDKNYILLSLALIFESLRLYVADSFESINKEFYDIFAYNEKYNNYDICNFFIELLNSEYKKLKLVYKDSSDFNFDQKERLKKSIQSDKKTYPLTQNEFIKIQNSFKNKDEFADLNKKIKEKRNTLAHIDSKGANFQSIKNSISALILEYERLTSIND
ncbi:MAG: hypothetical protein K5978_05415 [Campylobacter sp.]|nr:hypothetical protein [Campylobacter sp.]